MLYSAYIYFPTSKYAQMNYEKICDSFINIVLRLNISLSYNGYHALNHEQRKLK